MALYDVTAIALNPHTGAVVSGPRVERIDTEANELFATCSREWDVEDTYEALWNRLNDHWESDFPTGQDKVKVLAVKLVEKVSTRHATALIKLTGGKRLRFSLPDGSRAKGPRRRQ